MQTSIVMYPNSLPGTIQRVQPALKVKLGIMTEIRQADGTQRSEPVVVQCCLKIYDLFERKG